MACLQIFPGFLGLNVTIYLSPEVKAANTSVPSGSVPLGATDTSEARAIALRIWSFLRLEKQVHPQPGPAEPADTLMGPPFFR